MGMFKFVAIGSALLSLPLGFLVFNQFTTDTCGLVSDSARIKLLDSFNPNTIIRLNRERSVSEKDICRMPIAKLKKALNRLDFPKPDHPGEARTFRNLQQLSDDKTLNVENWSFARQQVNTLRTRVMAGAGVNSNAWESIGPGNIGGRIRSFAFDPDNSNRIYAGSVSGGIWLTEDSGASWNALDDFMANLSVSTLIFDATNSNVIYAGTGEGTFNVDNVRGLGIFKSTDKGVSWEALSSTQNNPDFYWVNRLTMLNDGSRLVAATHSGIWTSDDAGVNWIQRYSGRINDVDVHPTDNNLLIAGAWGAAMYSEDGGINWISASGLTGLSSQRVEIAYSKSNPAVVFASIDLNSGEVWKSSDGGRSFNLVNTGNNYLGSQGWYDNALWVDPINADHIIVGGIDLWRSVDGGATLSRISTWWQAPSSAHADHHFVMAHPEYDGSTNKQVYFANDGGMYLAADIEVAQDNVGWQELNNNLAITQFYGMGVSPDGTVVGGTQDNGTLVFKGDSESWTDTFGGDGGFSAADPTDSNYIYGEYVYLRIHRSTNGGLFSSYIYDSAMTNDGPNFIAPFILDPNNENRLLGGAGQLWMSDDVKAVSPSWTSIKAANPANSPISAIAVAKGNSDLIYVGHNDGSLYKTDDGTSVAPTWTQVATVDMPQRFLMRVAIDPTDNDVVFASFGGYQSNNLWKSLDGGMTWNLSVGSEPNIIPPAPIRTIAIHATRPNQVYVGTEVGIFTSDDGGDSWDFANNGPANVSVDELVWADTDILYAATHGRGIFRANVREDVPNTLTFNPVIDAARNTVVESEQQIVTGLGIEVDVSIVDGEYSINCTGTYTNSVGRINNGDTLCLRHTSSAAFFTSVTTQISVGFSTFEFESRTVADITPDAFTFDALVDVELTSEQLSNTIVVSGITNQVNVSIADGEYSIDCDSNNFTASAGIISLGESICVRHTAASESWVTTTTLLTLGDVTVPFESTTLPDTTPDAFSFDSLDDVPVSSNQNSQTVVLSGFQVAIPISVSGGEYSIGCAGDGFTTSSEMIEPDESVCVRHTTSSDYLTSTTTTLDINGVTADFISMTSPDRDPDSFAFNAISDAELNTRLTSSTITVSGIGVDVVISVSGGEYSIGCTTAFTSAAAMIGNGQSVCLRHTSSTSNSATVSTTLNVGTFSAVFSSTTKPAPPKGSGGGNMLWLLLLLTSTLLLKKDFRRGD